MNIKNLDKFIKKTKKKEIKSELFTFKTEIAYLLCQKVNIKNIHIYLKQEFKITTSYMNLYHFVKRNESDLNCLETQNEILGSKSIILSEKEELDTFKADLEVSNMQIDTAKPLSNQEKYKFEDDLKEKKILTYNEILKIYKIFGFIDFKKHFQKFIFTPNLNLLDTNEFRLTDNMSQEQQGELVKSRIKEEIAMQISEIAQRDIYLKQKDEILLLMKENINNNIPTSFSLTDFPPNLTTNPFKINSTMTDFEKDIVKDLELDYKIQD